MTERRYPARSGARRPICPDQFRLDSQAPGSPVKPSHRDGGSISGNSSTVRSHHWCWRWREEPDRTTCIGHQFKGCLLPITLTIWGVPDQFPCAPPNPACKQIGRASCRERVCQYVYISVVAASLKNKKNTK